MDLMPLIEAKVKQGIRHVDIIQALNEQGFAISEHTYRSYLQRYRKKQIVGGKSARAGAPALNKPAAGLTVSGTAGRPETFNYDPRGIPELQAEACNTTNRKFSRSTRSLCCLAGARASRSTT